MYTDNVVREGNISSRVSVFNETHTTGMVLLVMAIFIQLTSPQISPSSSAGNSHNGTALALPVCAWKCTTVNYHHPPHSSKIILGSNISYIFHFLTVLIEQQWESTLTHLHPTERRLLLWQYVQNPNRAYTSLFVITRCVLTISKHQMTHNWIFTPCIFWEHFKCTWLTILTNPL